jgi:hypothetical protein
MRIRFFLFVVMLVVAAACSSRVSDEGGATADTLDAAVSLAGDTIPPAEVATVVADTSGCTTGQAEPVLRESVYPNAVFTIKDDTHSGVESTMLKNGDKLIIHHTGCEYYILSFRFETSRFAGDTTDIPFWLGKTYELLSETKDGIDSEFVGQCLDDLSAHIRSGGKVAVGEEIVFHDEDIRNYATFDRVQKIDDKTYAVEISFLSGPY